jgi:hypothetical protein
MMADRARERLDSHPHSARSRHSKFDHAAEDAAREPSLYYLSIRVTRVQPIAKNLLVEHERVLGSGLMGIGQSP